MRSTLLRQYNLKGVLVCGDDRQTVQPLKLSQSTIIVVTVRYAWSQHDTVLLLLMMMCYCCCCCCCFVVDGDVDVRRMLHAS